ncbi:MAG: hypothetical protein H7070_02755 [Saprospiraceae bacterium]|nr:hypothetical protein [Pyrinomonadaceae bacterium]
MRFERDIAEYYRKSVEDAFDTILEKGNDFHRHMASQILQSDLLVRVQPVSIVKASGVTGLIDADETNEKIADGRLGFIEALGEVYISIAEETIDTGGQRGCEGTFVHEGRHAYDFAQTIETLSNAAVNPLSIFDPTLYELELAAHKNAGEYMLQVASEDYLTEGLELLILGRNGEGQCFLNDVGIGCRLRDNYGLTIDGNPGAFASQLLGLRQK